MAMLSWCDACMMNPDGGVLPWVCLLDVASTHISKEFQSRVSLCGQPLDLTFMKAFKSSLARQAAEHVAWMILGAPRADFFLNLHWVRSSGYFGEPLVQAVTPHVPIMVSKTGDEG